MVGASHANRTADALEREGATVMRAVIPGWRALKQKIPPMVELVRAKLSTVREDCTVVFQLFDNSFYMARTEEGGLIPAVKQATAGSTYHIHSELVFAPKELQYSVCNTVKPVLEAAASFQKIVISPLPRYLHTSCCEEKGHISNLEDEDYKSNLEEAVLSCRRNLKDFAFRQGVRSVRTVCPWSQLKKIEDNLWPSDPVHMCDRGYTALAGLVLSGVQQNGGLDLNPNSGRGGGGRLGATPSGGTPRPTRGCSGRGGGWRARPNY